MVSFALISCPPLKLKPMLMSLVPNSLLGSSLPIIFLKESLLSFPLIDKIALPGSLSDFATKSERFTFLKLRLSTLLTACILPLQPSNVSVLLIFLKSLSSTF